jgi:hypothetical protein
MDYSLSSFLVLSFEYEERQYEIGPRHKVILEKKTGKNSYQGTLFRPMAGSSREICRSLPCRVTYPNVEDTTCFELVVDYCGEWNAFLYDHRNKSLLDEEPAGLSKRIAYVNYLLVLPETVFRTNMLTEVTK